MAFVNLSLLLGAALIGVPIVLHMVMRQQPRQLVFPAVRFIQQRQETNRRTLRMRHWLLLALRCLAIALAALALARPSVDSAMFGNWILITFLAVLLLLLLILLLINALSRKNHLLSAALIGGSLIALASLITMLISTLGRGADVLIGDREAPVAAVMILDSSPRMQYRLENRTRLEEAQETAEWLVRELPPDSKVAILDSQAVMPVFSVDMSAARKTIQRIKPAGLAEPLEHLLEKALDMLAESEQQRKEIYLLSDLTAAAWQVDDAATVRDRLEQAKDITLYVIDVGIEDPQNFTVGPLQLSTEVLSENGELVIRTAMQRTGAAGQRAIELLVEDPDPLLPVIRDDEVILPKLRLRSRQDVELAANGTQETEFRVSNLTQGTHHGVVKLIGQDGLSVDDARFFTVLVRDPWLILVVAPEDVSTVAFVEALAPYEMRAENRARFEFLAIKPTELANHTLSDFAVVCLLDPTPMGASQWQRLDDYVRGGGSAAIFLGHHAQVTDSFNEPAAQQLLPGKLGRQYRAAGRDIYLAPHSYDHPIMRPFRSIASSVPWDRFPVFRYWSLRDLSADSQVILRYGDGQPAILERRVGQGSVLTMTTPITELERPAGRQAWNELAGPDDWPRFILVNQIVQFLANRGTDHFNYEVGQTASLVNRKDRDPGRYLLFTPNGETQPLQARDGRLVVSTTDYPGTYRLKGERGAATTRGFSTNLPEADSLLDRIAPEQLDQVLGEKRYQLADDRDQIERVQGRQRAGREFFPFLVATLAIALVLEHLLANRFYPATDTS